MINIQETGNQEQEALELSLIERVAVPMDRERAKEVGMNIKEAENFRDLVETISTAEREGYIRRVMPKDPDARDAEFYHQRIKFYTGQLKEKELPTEEQQKCREQLKAISRMFFSIANPRTGEQKDYFPSARLPHTLEKSVKEKMTDQQQGVVRENFSIGGRIIKELNDKRTELVRREIVEREKTQEFKKKDVRTLTDTLGNPQLGSTSFDAIYFDGENKYAGLLVASATKKAEKTYLALSARSGNMQKLLAKIGEENARDILCESFENEDGCFFRLLKNGKKLVEDEKLKPLHIILSRQLRNEERAILEKNLREQEKEILSQSTAKSLSELKDKEGAYAFRWTEMRKTTLGGKEKTFANEGIVVVAQKKKGNNLLREVKVYGPLKQQVRFERGKLEEILKEKEKQERAEAEKAKNPWPEKEARQAVTRAMEQQRLVESAREAAQNLLKILLQNIDILDADVVRLDKQIEQTSDMDAAAQLEQTRNIKNQELEETKARVYKQLSLDPEDPSIIFVAGEDEKGKNTMSVVRITKNNKGEEVEKEVFTTVV